MHNPIQHYYDTDLGIIEFRDTKSGHWSERAQPRDIAIVTPVSTNCRARLQADIAADIRINQTGQVIGSRSNMLWG